MGTRLLELEALLVQHLGVLAQGRTLTHDSRLEHFPLRDLFAQSLSLGSKLGRLRIELLLLDAVEVGWPLAALGQLLRAALSAHVCRRAE